MSGAQESRSIGRSIAAVLAGFVAVVILSIGTDALLRTAGIFPPLGKTMTDSLFLLATFYRTIYFTAGSYITARLAPGRPMQHALMGGVLGLVVSTAGALATWNRTELGPHWYPVALLLVAVPAAWAGGRLCLLTSAQRSSAA